jgi:hypothetical protein
MTPRMGIPDEENISYHRTCGLLRTRPFSDEGYFTGHVCLYGESIQGSLDDQRMVLWQDLRGNPENPPFRDRFGNETDCTVLIFRKLE